MPTTATAGVKADAKARNSIQIFYMGSGNSITCAVTTVTQVSAVAVNSNQKSDAGFEPRHSDEGYRHLTGQMPILVPEPTAQPRLLWVFGE